MRGIKIPQYEFALKMQGGLCARGGVHALINNKLIYVLHDEVHQIAGGVKN